MSLEGSLKHQVSYLLPTPTHQERATAASRAAEKAVRKAIQSPPQTADQMLRANNNFKLPIEGFLDVKEAVTQMNSLGLNHIAVLNLWLSVNSPEIYAAVYSSDKVSTQKLLAEIREDYGDKRTRTVLEISGPVAEANLVNEGVALGSMGIASVIGGENYAALRINTDSELTTQINIINCVGGIAERMGMTTPVSGRADWAARMRLLFPYPGGDSGFLYELERSPEAPFRSVVSPTDPDQEVTLCPAPRLVAAIFAGAGRAISFEGHNLTSRSFGV